MEPECDPVTAWRSSGQCSYGEGGNDHSNSDGRKRSNRKNALRIRRWAESEAEAEAETEKKARGTTLVGNGDVNVITDGVVESRDNAAAAAAAIGSSRGRRRGNDRRKTGNGSSNAILGKIDHHLYNVDAVGGVGGAGVGADTKTSSYSLYSYSPVERDRLERDDRTHVGATAAAAAVVSVGATTESATEIIFGNDPSRSFLDDEESAVGSCVRQDYADLRDSPPPSPSSSSSSSSSSAYSSAFFSQTLAMQDETKECCEEKGLSLSMPLLPTMTTTTTTTTTAAADAKAAAAHLLSFDATDGGAEMSLLSPRDYGESEYISPPSSFDDDDDDVDDDDDECDNEADVGGGGSEVPYDALLEDEATSALCSRDPTVEDDYDEDDGGGGGGGGAVPTNGRGVDHAFNAKERVSCHQGEEGTSKQRVDRAEMDQRHSRPHPSQERLSECSMLDSAGNDDGHARSDTGQDVNVPVVVSGEGGGGSGGGGSGSGSGTGDLYADLTLALLNADQKKRSLQNSQSRLRDGRFKNAGIKASGGSLAVQTGDGAALAKSAPTTPSSSAEAPAPPLRLSMPATPTSSSSLSPKGSIKTVTASVSPAPAPAPSTPQNSIRSEPFYCRASLFDESESFAETISMSMSETGILGMSSPSKCMGDAPPSLPLVKINEDQDLGDVMTRLDEESEAKKDHALNNASLPTRRRAATPSSRRAALMQSMRIRHKVISKSVSTDSSSFFDEDDSSDFNVVQKKGDSSKKETKDSMSKEITTRDSNKKETKTKDSMLKEISTKDSMSKEINKKDLMSKETDTKDSMSKETNTKDSMSIEINTKDSMPKETNTKDSMSKGINTKDSMSTDTLDPQNVEPKKKVVGMEYDSASVRKSSSDCEGTKDIPFIGEIRKSGGMTKSQLVDGAVGDETDNMVLDNDKIFETQSVLTDEQEELVQTWTSAESVNTTFSKSSRSESSPCQNQQQEQRQNSPQKCDSESLGKNQGSRVTAAYQRVLSEDESGIYGLDDCSEQESRTESLSDAEQTHLHPSADDKGSVSIDQDAHQQTQSFGESEDEEKDFCDQDVQSLNDGNERGSFDSSETDYPEVSEQSIAASEKYVPTRSLDNCKTKSFEYEGDADSHWSSIDGKEDALSQSFASPDDEHENGANINDTKQIKDLNLDFDEVAKQAGAAVTELRSYFSSFMCASPASGTGKDKSQISSVSMFDSGYACAPNQGQVAKEELDKFSREPLGAFAVEGGTDGLMSSADLKKGVFFNDEEDKSALQVRRAKRMLEGKKLRACPTNHLIDKEFINMLRVCDKNELNAVVTSLCNDKNDKFRTVMFSQHDSSSRDATYKVLTFDRLGDLDEESKIALIKVLANESNHSEVGRFMSRLWISISQPIRAKCEKDLGLRIASWARRCCSDDLDAFPMSLWKRSGKKDRKGLVADDTNHLPTKVRDDGEGAIDSLAETILSYFPDHGVGVELVGSAIIDELLVELGLRTLKEDIDWESARAKYPDVSTFVLDIVARRMKKNPILVAFGAAWSKLDTCSPQLFGPSGNDHMEADVRFAIAYCFLHYIICITYLSSPRACDSVEEGYDHETVLANEQRSFLDKLLYATDTKVREEKLRSFGWESSIFEKNRMDIVQKFMHTVALPMKAGGSRARETLEQQQFQNTPSISFTILETMCENVRNGIDANAAAGLELFMEPPGPREFDKAMKSGIAKEWIVKRSSGSTTRYGVLMYKAPFPRAWNNIFDAWSLASASVYPDAVDHFAPLLAPILCDMRPHEKDGLFLSARFVSMHLHIHYLMCARSNLDSPYTTSTDFRNDVATQLLGLVNREAAGQYRMLVDTVIEEEGRTLFVWKHEGKRLALQSIWATLKAAIVGMQGAQSVPDDVLRLLSRLQDLVGEWGKEIGVV